MAESSNPLQSVVEWIARSPKRAFLVVFVVAVASRSVVLPFLPSQAVVPSTAWEIESIAASLARTGTFADPYALPTGPTAHVPPVYPALLGLIYRAFGLTMTAGYAAWMLRILVSSAVFALLPWAGLRLGVGAHAGVVGGLAGALVPQPFHQVEPLAALAMAILLVAGSRRWAERRTEVRGSALLGVAWGAAFHVTPSLLAVFAGCLVFEAWWLRDRRAWLRSGAMVLGAALACVPWAWRNHETFGEVFFVRSNFGLELRMGNHEGATADVDVTGPLEGSRLRHPRANPDEARLVRQMGEVAYMRQAGREALDWIRSHPAAYARLTALRVFHFWWGSPSMGWTAIGAALLTLLAILGAWRVVPVLDAPRRAALLIPLATYPIVYYFVVFTSRYGEPVNWILFLFAGAEGWRWLGGRDARDVRPRPRSTSSRPPSR